MRTTTITRAGRTTSRSRWTLCERSDLDISSCIETIRLLSLMRRSSTTASTKSPMLKRCGGRSIDLSSLETCTLLIYPTFRTDLSRSWLVVPIFRSPMQQTQSQETTWWITTTLKLSWNEPRTTSTYWRHVNSDNSFFHYCFLSRSSLNESTYLLIGASKGIHFKEKRRFKLMVGGCFHHHYSLVWFYEHQHKITLQRVYY